MSIQHLSMPLFSQMVNREQSLLEHEEPTKNCATKNCATKNCANTYWSNTQWANKYYVKYGPYNKEHINFIPFKLIPYNLSYIKKVAEIIYGSIWEIGWDGYMVIITCYNSRLKYQCRDATIRDILISFCESKDIVPEDKYLDSLVSLASDSYDTFRQFTVHDDPTFALLFNDFYVLN